MVEQLVANIQYNSIEELLVIKSVYTEKKRTITVAQGCNAKV
jgi:hypothetical protein